MSVSRNLKVVNDSKGKNAGKDHLQTFHSTNLKTRHKWLFIMTRLLFVEFSEEDTFPRWLELFISFLKNWILSFCTIQSGSQQEFKLQLNYSNNKTEVAMHTIKNKISKSQGDRK